MNLVGYTATALSRNDIEDTPTNKNVVDFAIVELKDLQGNLVAIYDDAEGANPETQKTCDIDGQVTFFAEIGDYNLEINGKAQRINLAANIADYIKLGTGESVQEFADSFALKIFQSPADSGLTEIQTRTVDANEVYEVRKVSDGSLATIYSDTDGQTEILQDGTDNASGSDGVVEFYIADGDYYVEVGGVKSGLLVSNLNVFDTVADMISAIYLNKYLENTPVNWGGYYEKGDGGGNSGLLKFGAHTSDGGSVFSIDSNTYVEANLLGNKINARKFGANSDPANTSKLQSFLDYIADNQKLGTLGRGSFAFDEDLIFHRNCNITGVGHSFGSALIPYGNAKIKFDGEGEAGGFVFHASLKNCVINGLQSTLSANNLITINKAFSIDIAVRVENLSTSTLNNLIYITSSNDIKLYSPILFGTTNSSGRGVLVGNDATVKIYAPDLEVLNRGLVVEGNEDTVVDVYGIYTERCITSIQNLGGTLNLFGGKVSNPSSGAVAGILNDKTSVYGTSVLKNGGLGFTSTASTNPDVNFYGVDDDLISGDWLTGSNNSSLKGGVYSFERTVKKESLADDTYANLFSIENAVSNSSFTVNLELWCSSSGFGKSYKNFKFMAAKESGGNYTLSNIAEVDMTSSTSANWSVEVFFNAVTNSTGVTLQGKFTGTGSLNSGVANNLKAKALITFDSSSTKVKTL